LVEPATACLLLQLQVLVDDEDGADPTVDSESTVDSEPTVDSNNSCLDSEYANVSASPVEQGGGIEPQTKVPDRDIHQQLEQETSVHGHSASQVRGMGGKWVVTGDVLVLLHISNRYISNSEQLITF
jgi:hypothetical protein